MTDIPNKIAGRWSHWGLSGVRVRCGGSVVVVWRRCGGGVEAVWGWCGGGVGVVCEWVGMEDG